MTGVKVTGFFLSVIGLPIVGQLPAQTVMEKMATGTTQIVLSIVVVCLGLAIIQMYRNSRLDLQKKDDKFETYVKDQNQKMQELLSANAAATQLHAQNSKELEEAIYALVDTVKDLKRKVTPEK